MSWYVSVKATDVVATYKMLYLVVIVPICLSLYNLLFLLLMMFKYDYHFGAAFKLTIWFSIIFPVYLYYSIRWSDKLLLYMRRSYLRFKYFVFYKETGKTKLKELMTTRLFLQKKIRNLIDYYQDSLLKEETEKRVIRRRDSETNIDDKIDKMIKTVNNLK